MHCTTPLCLINYASHNALTRNVLSNHCVEAIEKRIKFDPPTKHCKYSLKPRASVRSDEFAHDTETWRVVLWLVFPCAYQILQELKKSCGRIMELLLFDLFAVLSLPLCVPYSAGLTNLTIITVTTEVTSRTCETITTDIPICINVGWNNTSFPNLRAHETQAEAYAELEDFSPLIQAQCSNKIVHFLCAVYTPICLPQESSDAIVVMPCRSLCEYVRNDCEPSLQGIGYSWPSHLACDNFPDHLACLDVDDDVEIPFIPELVVNPPPATSVTDSIPSVITPSPPREVTSPTFHPSEPTVCI